MIVFSIIGAILLTTMMAALLPLVLEFLVLTGLWLFGVFCIACFLYQIGFFKEQTFVSKRLTAAKVCKGSRRGVD